MESIRQLLRNVRIGDPVVHENLTMFPLFLGESGNRDYLTLGEALAGGKARVSETSDAGSVPELLFVNEGDRSVLLVDGEELRGAKQNRVLNLSILVPAGKTIVIPVSCVEAGRWAWQTAEFAAMGRHGTRVSDQQEIWREIFAKQQALGASSPTAAMSSLFEVLHGGVDGYVQAARPVAGQNGAAFALNGRIAGCELFDHADTLSRLFAKIVRSYALDAMETHHRGAEPTPPEAVREFLDEIAVSRMESFPSLGLGEDVRISSGELAGGALVVGDRVVHLAAFRLSEVKRGGREELRQLPDPSTWFRRRSRRSDGGTGEAA